MSEQNNETDTPLSNLKNKLGPLFTLVQMINEDGDDATRTMIDQEAEKCDLAAIRELLAKLEPKEDTQALIEFGKYVHDIRFKKEITLRSFCRAATLDPANWSKIERGIADPPKSIEVLTRISHALGLDLEQAKELIDLATIFSIPTDLRPSDSVMMKFIEILKATRRGTP